VLKHKIKSLFDEQGPHFCQVLSRHKRV